MDSEALTLSSGFAAADPLVYIVVLNWNGREDTLACLRSLEPVWNERTKGIVVDNGSTDGSPDAALHIDLTTSHGQDGRATAFRHPLLPMFPLR